MKPDTCYRDNVRMFKIHGICDQEAEEKEDVTEKTLKDNTAQNVQIC